MNWRRAWKHVEAYEILEEHGIAWNAIANILMCISDSSRSICLIGRALYSRIQDLFSDTFICVKSSTSWVVRYRSASYPASSGSPVSAS